MLNRLTRLFGNRGGQHHHADIKFPSLYISFGMPKSGSTMAFEITKRLFELNGHRQVRLSDKAVEPAHHINFVRKWDDEGVVEALIREARRTGSTIVIKTHTAPSAAVARLVESGDITGHCICRDPRDIALSMKDHGAKARKAGEVAFAKIVSIEDTLAPIAERIRVYELWSALNGFPTITYANLLCSRHLIAEAIEEQMGFKCEIDDVYRYVNANTFTQFNKGVLNRYETEMSAKDNGLFSRRFQTFIKLVDSLSAEH